MNEFGDVVCVRDDHGAVHVLEAPPLTRIDLVSLIHNNGDITLTDGALCVAGRVWYQPVDLTPDGLTLICRKTRDLRPLIGQVKEDRARV